jgi:type II secretory pathway pseudopilin PulG
MKTHPIPRASGFTLLETVIAIGVLAVLLTGFMVVFAPAADGIRKSINVQQADRMASALEQELVTLRKGEESADTKTGFDKAFDRIKASNTTASNALFAYQYRGGLMTKDNKPIPLRDDGTFQPSDGLEGLKPGEHYIVVPIVRSLNDPKLKEDLAALEGAVYLVKCTQLVFEAGQLIVSKSPGTIRNPKPKPTADTDPPYEAGPFDQAAKYPEAVITFSADFYLMPAKTEAYFKSNTFKDKFSNLKNPVFSRNLAVRR